MKRKIMLPIVAALLASCMLHIPSSASSLAMHRNIIAQRLSGSTHHQRLLSVENSLHSYLQEMYNSNDYSDYLSHNINHLIIMLGTIKKLSLDQDGAVYAYTILKLFTDKMKSCEMVTYTVVEQILRFLPSLIGCYFEAEEAGYSLRSLRTFIGQMLEAKLTQYAPSKYSNNEKTSSSIAHSLAHIEYKRQQETLDTKQAIWRLRLMTQRFIDTLLSKVVWSQAHYESNWPSFLKIAHLIEMLTKRNIIDHRDDVDSLQWALVHRFRYFITLTGSIFPIDFYENIEHDLKNHCVPFLLSEQDAVKTKNEVLLETVILGKTKAIAYRDAGIIDAVF